MKVHVTVETSQGIILEPRVFKSQRSARKAEAKWLKENGVKDPDSREGKADNGTEFLVFEAETEP